MEQNILTLDILKGIFEKWTQNVILIGLTETAACKQILCLKDIIYFIYFYIKLINHSSSSQKGSRWFTIKSLQ